MAGFPHRSDSTLNRVLDQGPPLLDLGLSGSFSSEYRDTKSHLNIVPTTVIPSRRPSRTDELARLVEAEIIPRLMLAHNATPAPDIQIGLDVGTVDSFARMALSEDADFLITHIGALLQSGLAMETIYMDLMTPAARLLGDYWLDDSISFTDVTIGLGRLQQVVRTLGWKQAQSSGADPSAPSALFVPATTEQHTFGLFLLEDSFRRGGWRTWIETSTDEADVVDMVRGGWFDMFGLSASCESQQHQVAHTIAAVRKASRNRGLFIMVGGRLFMERPELVSVVGADATAPTGRDALLIADKAVRRLAAHA